MYIYILKTLLDLNAALKTKTNEKKKRKGKAILHRMSRKWRYKYKCLTEALYFMLHIFGMIANHLPCHHKQ